MTATGDDTIPLSDLRYCFEGVIPAVIATASATGVPNVTYLSTVRMVDDERIALSNQFFSKTVRNLAENPRASLLVLDPITYDEYRLTVAYERTDRRGLVFDRLREDLGFVAAISGMEDVFKLRAADIYRVVAIERTPQRPRTDRAASGPRSGKVDPGRIAELSARLSRCPDLNAVVSAAVDGLAELFGYDHSLLMLVDECGTRLYTIASHGYPTEGVGSEIVVGEGMIGIAAERCTPINVGNLRLMSKYSRTVRRSYEESGELGPGEIIEVPALPEAWSRVAVPAMALGELIGVLMVESPEHVAFDRDDEAVLTIVASIVANAIEVERSRERTAEVNEPPPPAAGRPAGDRTATTHVRFFPADGSTFVDGDYLIKGVAGRILWALLGHHAAEGRVEFTNREVRLDPSLELPEFRDNFESRLILLKRRLDERHAPIRIEKTGRGRFRLHVEGEIRLDIRR